MTDDYRRLLAEGDPVAREPELDVFHAQTMRQRVVLESRSERVEREVLSRALAVAAAIAACLIVGVTVGLRMNDRQPLAPAPVATHTTPRQMQFSTPGGTRIIWTFHQEFDL